MLFILNRRPICHVIVVNRMLVYFTFRYGANRNTLHGRDSQRQKNGRVQEYHQVGWMYVSFSKEIGCRIL